MAFRIFFKILIIFFICFFNYSGFSQIVINEIQSSPVGDEPEWVEIFNCSDKVFNLQSGWFCDAISWKKLPDFSIEQGQYAILTKDTLTLKTIRNLSNSIMLIEFSLPSLNNTWDCLSIRNLDSSIIDSIYYNMSWGYKGITLERIDCSLPAYDSKNWLPSKSIDSATCGYVNSVTRKNFDLKIKNIFYQPNSFLKIEIINDGNTTNSPSECLCLIYNTKITKEITFNIPPLSPQSQFDYIIAFDTINLSDKFYGTNNCIVISNLVNDENRANDTLFSELYFSYPYRTIQINEFLFDPRNFSSDFVEFYNSSEDTISLKNWLIHDKTVTSKADTFKISFNIVIYPKDYAVVAFDSTFFNKFPDLFGLEMVLVKKSSFNLNADEDEIVIKDPNNITVDSLRYNKKWHLEELEDTKDISLEKINPDLLSSVKESWTSSTAPKGATPAKANSINQPVHYEGSLNATPNPFSPFSNNIDHFCIISYELPFKQAKITANIFNLNGEKVRELSNLDISSAKGNLVWDGKNNEGFNLEIGPYILLLEAIDLISGKVFSDKIVLIIGK